MQTFDSESCGLLEKETNQMGEATIVHVDAKKPTLEVFL